MMRIICVYHLLVLIFYLNGVQLEMEVCINELLQTQASNSVKKTEHKSKFRVSEENKGLSCDADDISVSIQDTLHCSFISFR